MNPDPIRIQGFGDQILHTQKNSRKFFWYLFLIKNCNLRIPRPPKRTSKLHEKHSALKRKHSTLQKMKFMNFFCGSFLPSWIRIQGPHWIRIYNTAAKSSWLLLCLFPTVRLRRPRRRTTRTATVTSRSHFLPLPPPLPGAVCIMFCYTYTAVQRRRICDTIPLNILSERDCQDENAPALRCVRSGHL
jgi:hypothetical protein